MDSQLNIDGMKLLNTKILHDLQYQAVWLIAGKWSSMQSYSAHTPIDMTKIKYLALSQGYKPPKQFTIKNCTTD